MQRGGKDHGQREIVPARNEGKRRKGKEGVKRHGQRGMVSGRKEIEGNEEK